MSETIKKTDRELMMQARDALNRAERDGGWSRDTVAAVSALNARIAEMDREMIEDAKKLAFERHANQKYGHRPYTYHLQMVVDTVIANGGGPEDIAAAWLHDSVEDTETTKEELAQRFGARVADMVWAVTGVGENREECMRDAIAKIPHARGAGDLKLADRHSNVKACIEEGKFQFVGRYVDEQPELRKVLPKGPLLDSLEALIAIGAAEIAKRKPKSGMSL